MSTQTTSAIERRPVAVAERGIVISDIDGMWRWAQYVAASGLAPKGIEKPESIFVATQMGLEVGLTPMAALQNIAVINGRPTIWGDAQLGIVRATGELEEFAEWYEVGGQKTTRNPSKMDDDVAAVCRVKRNGFEAQESAFSVADAKKANLWGKAGPWSQYPARMLRFRARGFALRDNFGDALRGMMSTEEAQDMPVIDVTPPKPARFRAPSPAVAESTTSSTAGPATRVIAEVMPFADAVVESAAKPAQEPTVESQATPGPSEPATADPGPDALSAKQSELAQFVTAQGKTFDSFQAAIVKLNWIPGAETWTGFADVPDEPCTKLLNAKRGLNLQMEKSSK